ncbi:MAG: hypothetical protein UHN02_04565 [Acutalibacteraceae bacterium]|nr:hypothetical protein [Acutalibacteraceae bacterium]
MNNLQEKLNFLLDKYSVENSALLKDKKTVVIDGMDVPLLSHRNERRFVELKNIVQGGTLFGVSVMRVARIVEAGTDLNDVLYRELDLCRFILGEKIKSVMSMSNDNVINVIATTENDIVCTIEISATLKKDAKPIDKHEIISQRGIACDVVVDAQLKQDSIYVYGDEEKKYTDVDFELYGLSIDEIAVVRAAFTVAQNKNYDEMLKIDSELKNLVEKVMLSAKTCERQVI